MKRLITLLLFSGIILPGMASDPVIRNTTAAAPAYTLAKSESGINLYTRWLPVDDTRSARQVKVCFAVDAPMAAVQATLLDDAQVSLWMKGTCEYRRLTDTTAGMWHTYIRFSIPWPLNDQDCIIRYAVVKQTPSCYEITIDGEPGFLELKDGVKRISHMTGSWKLMHVSPSRTLVEYTIFSAEPSSFPKWITDPIIQNNMIDSMEAFREHVDRRTGGQADKRTGGRADR